MTVGNAANISMRLDASVTTDPLIGVVVPCFNEEECIGELHRRLTAICRKIAGDRYEIILVNDGSSDRTWALMNGLAANHPHLVCVNLSRNHGQEHALTAGLSLCGAQYTLIIDADLQDPPELLEPMLEMLLHEKADVVYGQRRTREGETYFKRTSAALFYRGFRKLSDIDVPLDTGDFRLMTRRVVDAFLSMPEQARFVRGCLAWVGFKQIPYLYDRDARFAGVTKYPLSKQVQLAMDAVTAFSVAPLRIASYLGIALGLGGVLLFAYAIVSWLSGAAVAGWASLASIVTILGSVQMFLLGLVGEYVGRIYVEVKRRPLFVVDEIVRGGAAGAETQANRVSAGVLREDGIAMDASE